MTTPSPRAWRDPADPVWAQLSARLQPLAAQVAGRTDLVVAVRPEAGEGAAAAFDAERAEIRLAADAVLPRPGAARAAGARPGRAAGQGGEAQLAGLVVLHAGLARDRLGPPPADTPPDVARWASLLDAARSAARSVAARPAYRTWLRTVVAPGNPLAVAGEQPPVMATTVWTLALVAAGVLTPGEAARVEAHLILVLGPGPLAEVRRALTDGVAAETRAALLAAAARLSELVDAPGADGPGSAAADAADAAEALAAEVAAQSLTLLSPGAPPEAGDDRQLAADRREFAQSASRLVYEHAALPAETRHRPPGGPLLAEARRLGRALASARAREPQLSRVPSATPPGRSRLAELMRRDAQVAAGTRVTALPWRQLRRRQVPEPPLRVGLSWDISGSRRARHAEMCELAWAVAWAARRIGGEVAAVAWHNRPIPVVWPGRVPDAVVEPPCGGGSAGCPESLRALGGAMRLWSAGPRVVLVATDGRLPNRRHVQAEVDDLAAQGVTVLWLTDAPGDWRPRGALALDAAPGTALRQVQAHLAQALRSA